MVVTSTVRMAIEAPLPRPRTKRGDLQGLLVGTSLFEELPSMTSDEWQPVVRVGEPKFIAGMGNRIKVQLKTRGWQS